METLRASFRSIEIKLLSAWVPKRYRTELLAKLQWSGNKTNKQTKSPGCHGSPQENSRNGKLIREDFLEEALVLGRSGACMSDYKAKRLAVWSGEGGT